jgi:phosphate transport system substrate-binding protein
MLDESGWFRLLLLWIALITMLASCADPLDQMGMIRLDGSSTVYPLSEAVAEEFRRLEPEIRVTVGISGTGGGFSKFLRREAEILNASRPIRAGELRMASERSIEFIELPVAYDGIAVVVNPKNTWCTSLTVGELRRIWSPEAQGRVLRWNQIRVDWPEKPINLFGPGVDSGTYDHFTLAVVGDEGSSRGDFTSSEDDNVLVRGVAGDPYALGFFGLAYYEENKDRLRVVGIDDEEEANGDGPFRPSLATIFSGNYQPLSRPIFIYVNRDAANLPSVQHFVNFYLSEAPVLVREVGYIGLPDKAYEVVLDRFQRRVTGTVFRSGGSQVGLTVDELLNLETRS